MGQDTKGIYTDGKWEFDANVADCFEDMLGRSIPQYQLMRESVANLCRYALFNMNDKVLKKSTAHLLDIGCSDGIMIELLLNKFSDDFKDCTMSFTGIDVSEPMLDKAKHRLIDALIDKKVNLLNCDLRTSYPDGVFDIVTSILSIQFTPIEHRQRIIQNVYDSLSNANGTFIMVEKVLGNTSNLNRMFVDNYYDMKRDNGYSDEQIDRKRLSLEGVLVPVTNDWNIDLLKQAGFKQVDVFWRWMNFVGYVAIK